MIINITAYELGSFKPSMCHALKEQKSEEGMKFVHPLTKHEKALAKNFFDNKLSFRNWNGGLNSDTADDIWMEDVVQELEDKYPDYCVKNSKVVCKITFFREPGDVKSNYPGRSFKFYIDPTNDKTKNLTGSSLGLDVVNTIHKHSNGDWRDVNFCALQLQALPPEVKDTRSTDEKLKEKKEKFKNAPEGGRRLKKAPDLEQIAKPTQSS